MVRKKQLLSPQHKLKHKVADQSRHFYLVDAFISVPAKEGLTKAARAINPVRGEINAMSVVELFLPISFAGY
jgi:hypothetical protein